MDAKTHERWLADTRRFWNVDSAFDARFGRICSSPEFDAAADDATRERLWTEETEHAVARILKDIPIRRDWTCLEIGCGIGRLLKPIARRCRRVIGLDVSPRMIALAADYLAGVPNADVIVNDGRSMPGVPDGSVDLVYSHLAFQHITVPEVIDAYLSETRRVLRLGGLCRVQNWREAPRPVVQALKDVVRPWLGRERYVSPRCWRWSDGREVRFGGITFRPGVWRRCLIRHGLRPVAMELGAGHDFWMWTTAVRAAE